MAAGTSTYDGLAVPLNGESEIEQVTAANDVLTLTRVTAGTGDMIVLQDADGTAKLKLGADGAFGSGRIGFRAVTTAPTTGLTKGEFFVAFNGTVAHLGVCNSTAGKRIQWIRLRSDSLTSATV